MTSSEQIEAVLENPLSGPHAIPPEQLNAVQMQQPCADRRVVLHRSARLSFG